MEPRELKQLVLDLGDLARERGATPWETLSALHMAVAHVLLTSRVDMTEADLEEGLTLFSNVTREEWKLVRALMRKHAAGVGH